MKKIISYSMMIIILSLIIVGGSLLTKKNYSQAKQDNTRNWMDNEEVKFDRTFLPIIDMLKRLGFDIDLDKINRTKKIDDNESQLPTIQSKEALMALLKKHVGDYDYYYDRGIGDNVTVGAVEEKASEAADANYSGTNNQVEGVEEGDRVKTDGNYIYIINNSKISIINPDPKEAKVASELFFEGDERDILEIFLSENKLIVVGNEFGYFLEEPMVYETKKDSFVIKCMPYNYTERTFVKIYDLSNINNPVLVKDFTFDGYYISARTMEDNFYMISSRHINYYRDVSIENIPEYVDDILLPKFIDNKTGEESVVDYNKIKYFPDAIEPNYLLMVGIDLENVNETPDVNAYLGNTQNIYVSKDHLFAAMTEYNNNTTTIYRFSLDGGVVTEAGRGSVPGKILNQFSMDDYNQHFRIATTVGNMWDDTNPSNNNIYILDDSMDIVGKLEGIAEGEKIYSTRFMGDKVYMVTFKQIDPFFVIDTSDVTKPKILGYLKIPGFSNYLHMVDDTHVLGFGQDTYEGKWGIRTGGFKISLFDVADVNQPIEKDKTVIGTSGTTSELLYNHKALMYLRDINMMAFPIQVNDGNNYSFKGAYVFQVDGSKLILKGKLTQFEDDNDLTSYNAYEKIISRVLRIGDYLYTISDDAISIHNIFDLGKVGKIEL